MPDLSTTFRDFGILPDDLQPPPEKIRCFLSTSRIVSQYIATGIVSMLGLGLIIFIAMKMAPPLSLLGCIATLAGFAVFVDFVIHNDYRWVELDGIILRAKHLYTGRTIERSVNEIKSLNTINYSVRRLVRRCETKVAEKILGRVKCIDIRFRDGRTTLRIPLADPSMTNTQEIIEAVIYRMTQIGELDCKIAIFRRKPLLREIYWKGEKPSARSDIKVILISLALLATGFGILLGLLGVQEKERHEVASIPPHEIDIHTLIHNGPGDNRHVIITDLQKGGYAYEGDSDYWEQVWIAIFPKGDQAAEHKEIKVVLHSMTIRNESALVRLLKNGCIDGMCSVDLRSSWGTELGPNLMKANLGCILSSAWDIEDLSEPPSEARISGLFFGSYGCFMAALIIAIIFFWKHA
jgi:hypothetical protein